MAANNGWVCDSCGRSIAYYGTASYVTQCECMSIAGSNPTNVYCTYLCLCNCTTLRTVSDWGVGLWWDLRRWSCAYSCIMACDCSLVSESLSYCAGNPPLCQDILCSYTCERYVCINLNPACSYSYLTRGLSICIYATACELFGDCWACSYGCVCNSYMVQCYCSLPSNCTCEYERLWSLKDYSETQTVLDPDGILNYLAIGYS
jgi:hypothetical protein